MLCALLPSSRVTQDFGVVANREFYRNTVVKEVFYVAQQFL